MIYVAVMDYYATGEGRHLAIALYPSEAGARRILEEKLDPYYHRGIEVTTYEDSKYQNMVPPAYLDILRGWDKESPRGNLAMAARFFLSFDYNFS